jgi:hypothetical protein
MLFLSIVYLIRSFGKINFLAVKGDKVVSDRSTAMKSCLFPMKIPHINSQNEKQFVL